MTNNVYSIFDKSKELKNVSYTDGNCDFGVATLDRKVEIQRLNDKEFLLITPDGSHVHDRATLSEFIHVVSVFIDSEKRNYPKVDLIGCDYS